MADLGANLVSTLLLLLVVARLNLPQTQTPADTAPRLMPAQTAPTLSGTDQSDLLYYRLRPPPDTLLIDLTALGPRVPGPAAPQPLASLLPPLPRSAIAYVFSPVHHAALLEFTHKNGITLQEMTVPRALRADGPDGFSPAFLSLRTGPDPASIRPELLVLLTGGSTAPALGAAPYSPLTARLHHALLFGTNLTLLILGCWLLRRKR